MFLTFGVAWFTLRKIKDKRKKIFFALTYLSYFVFSGFGISIFPSSTYFYYYLIYLLIFSWFIVLFQNKTFRFNISDKEINQYIEKKGNYIIGIYVLLMCSSLLYPELKISKLWNPPVIDSSNVTFVLSYEDVDTVKKIKTLLLNFITPLYYICLIKYIKRPIVFLFLLVFPLYSSYCSSGYMGRSGIVLAFL